MWSLSFWRIHVVGQSVSSQSKKITVRRLGKAPGRGLNLLSRRTAGRLPEDLTPGTSTRGPTPRRSRSVCPRDTAVLAVFSASLSSRRGFPSSVPSCWSRLPESSPQRLSLPSSLLAALAGLVTLPHPWDCPAARRCWRPSPLARLTALALLVTLVARGVTAFSASGGLGGVVGAA